MPTMISGVLCNPAISSERKLPFVSPVSLVSVKFAQSSSAEFPSCLPKNWVICLCLITGKGNETTETWMDCIYPGCLCEGGHWVRTETAKREELIRASEKA